MSELDENSSVKVAVRIRPQLPKEKIDNCRICTSVTPGEPQVVLGNDKAFTFDIVFDTNTSQEIVFSECAQALIDGCFDGYNATILAYGQTGSGKTFSMGTGFELNTISEQVGIIPRAVRHLFDGIDLRRRNALNSSLPEPTYQVYAQFMELYNEDIYDLFDASVDNKKLKSTIRIHEDSNGNIYTQGVTSRLVCSYNETMECLRAGALSRTTASTNMNSQSSRSHAIFTLNVKITRSTVKQSNDNSAGDLEVLSAKFHFVDLAGSERLKRTGATGDRAKEGISINCGLLALGNVISALGDVTKKGTHVPYRDSKLTRLLQDSLGGNSRTVMIACISPSDRDFMETLNTLKYANRARNIKNRVVVNQDKTSKQLTELRTQIQALQLELLEYKQGKRIVGPDGVESINDMFHENSLLQGENDKLRHRVKALQETVDSLTSRNASLMNDRSAIILSGLTGDNVNEEVQKLISGYTLEMESLRTKLIESESMRATLNKMAKPSNNIPSVTLHHSSSAPQTPIMDSAASIIELAKQDVERSKRALLAQKEPVLFVVSDDKLEKGDSGGGSGVDDDSGEHEEDEDKENGAEDTDLELEDEDDEEPVTEEQLSSESDESESDHLHEDLAELSGEISIKQRMIEELEKSQRQLQNIRQHYEDKLRNLQNQIQEVERERDQVLSTLVDKQHQSDDQITKVKSEYEKKITGMQVELDKVKAAKKEHAKMMKNQNVYDKKIKELSAELNEMKKMKVRLMTQMKSESEKNKLNDQQKSKELIQLRKEKRVRENQLKMLELQNRQKDAILKRKHEEVNLLRKKQRESSVSAKALATSKLNSGQQNATKTPNTPPVRGKALKAKLLFSPKIARSKWDKLEHYISSVVMRKQTIAAMEAEMDLHIKKREELSKKIEDFNERLDSAIHKNQTELAVELEDILEGMTANMNYIQNNVIDCQTSIMQMEEEAKDESALGSLLDVSSLEESKYLLEHLLSLAMSRGFDCTQKDAMYKELYARYEKMHLDSRLRDSLMQQVLQDAGISLQVSQENDQTEDTSKDNSSLHSILPSEMLSSSDQLWAELSNRQMIKSHKARRRTATPAELLLGMMEPESTHTTTLPSDSPTNGKPTINIADILPPAPKGPPPGRGPPPPPIDTIMEEEETEASSVSLKTDPPKDDESLIRSASYTVLNSLMGDVHTSGDGGTGGSRSNSPDEALTLESSKVLAGSYTVISGEIELSQLPPTKEDVEEVKKIPPVVPPKPAKPYNTSGSGMNKWKGIVSSHLDELLSGDSNSVKTADGKPPLAGQSSIERADSSAYKDSNGRVLGRRKLGPPGLSPALRRKSFGSQQQSSKDKSTSSSTDIKEPRPTPPSSPSLGRKIKLTAVDSDSGSNVFTRLTNSTTNTNNNRKSSTLGQIQEYEKNSGCNGQSMTCTKIAKGHSKAVLCVSATDDLLLSGSKDQTCKVWDLTRGTELISLEDHPNYVTRVRYCHVRNLVYTVSNSFVKLWDIRSPSKCIKVLSSSGLVHDTIPVEPASSSTQLLQQGEQLIFDVQASHDGNALYTTIGPTVRVWDLRTYGAVGKIASGHQAPITCLSLYNTPDGSENLLTGSKDHFIKLFELNNQQSQNCIMQPKFTLEPPHYDGVQCLSHRGAILFSGSRDMCIKKWRLDDPCLLQSLNGAHKDWIQDMCMLPDNDVLVSCCRSGLVKVWSIDTCSLLDEVKAHSTSVYSLAANSSRVFTASNDCTVKIWSIDRDSLITEQ